MPDRHVVCNGILGICIRSKQKLILRFFFWINCNGCTFEMATLKTFCNAKLVNNILVDWLTQRQDDNIDKKKNYGQST